jgi:hypothetical protein
MPNINSVIRLWIRIRCTEALLKKGNNGIMSGQGIGELNNMKNRTSYAELNPDIDGIGVF